jgi:predicted nucleic acid-binding protein
MLLDTSGLLCLLHRVEPFHEKARHLYHSSRRKLTHDYVLAEWIALAQVRGVPRTLALEFVSDLIDNPDIHVVWTDETLYRAALSLLKHRLDKSYSLCDAVSFLILRQHDLDEALTTDHHFDQEGFRRLLV